MFTQAFEQRLAQTGRTFIRQHWEKAKSRLVGDPEGAITSARSLLESICIHALRVLGLPDDARGDLPKLYVAVANGLGIAAGGQTSQIHKRLFGAVHTIVQAVGELRNKAGDAHGRAGGEVPASQAEAEMAVFLAASVGNFLLVNVDSYIATRHRRAPNGDAILKFDRSTVWRLVDHAQNAPEHLSSYGEKRTKPSLWLVGDSGVYLMSNGSPPQLSDGSIIASDKAKQSMRLVAYAEGCSLDDEFDDWWPIHNAFANGSDFSITIPLKKIRPLLEESERYIVIVGTENGIRLYADQNYLDAQ